MEKQKKPDGPDTASPQASDVEKAREGTFPETDSKAVDENFYKIFMKDFTVIYGIAGIK